MKNKPTYTLKLILVKSNSSNEAQTASYSLDYLKYKDKIASANILGAIAEKLEKKLWEKNKNTQVKY